MQETSLGAAGFISFFHLFPSFLFSVFFIFCFFLFLKSTPNSYNVLPDLLFFTYVSCAQNNPVQKIAWTSGGSTLCARWLRSQKAQLSAGPSAAQIQIQLQLRLPTVWRRCWATTCAV
jgi:hypothetical protein